MIRIYSPFAKFWCRSSCAYSTRAVKRVARSHFGKKPIITKLVTTPTLNHPMDSPSTSQDFDYLLVLDFEATCDQTKIDKQEIIEFPVVALRTHDWTVEKVFHRYVRPVDHPVLTPFCTKLTGIIQEMVDDQQTLSEVLQHLNEWIKELPSKNFAFVTCGDWDLKTMLSSEVSRKRIPLPSYFDEWINIKKAYANHTGKFARGMTELISNFNLELVGRHHSGIDDAKNIAAVVCELGKLGYRYRITSSNTAPARTRLFSKQAV